MRFDQDFIEKVKDANNIVDIISRYTTLKASGPRFMGLCPFPQHKEKTPSFSVSANKQVYYCFGCKESGNIFTFLEKYNGMSFVEAIEFLAQRASIPLPLQPSLNKEPNRNYSEKSLFTKINSVALQYFQKTLVHQSKGQHGREYFERRGISAEQIILFKLGLATEEWDGLTQYLKQEGLPLKAAEELGLIKSKKQRAGEYFDLYRARVMFPIFSPSNEVIGFGGRSLGDEKPKYLNSSDSPVFAKGKTFYGLQETAKYLRAEDCAILVEGYMDFLALFQAGIKNVVATLGTALTPQHAQILSRHTRHVIVLFDGDQAGREAAERSLPILLQAGLLPRWLQLPDKVDPDDWVKASTDVAELKAQLQSAPDLFSALFKNWVGTSENRPTDVVRIVEMVNPVLSQVTDPRLKDLYMQEAASGLGVSKPWLVKAMQSEKSAAPLKRGESPPPKSRPSNDGTKDVEALFAIAKASRLEISFLSFAVQKEEFLQTILKENMMGMVENAGVRQALQFVGELYGQNSERFDKLTSLLITKLDAPERIVELLLEFDNGTSTTPEENQRLFNDCMVRVREGYLKREAKAVTEQLKNLPNRENLERFMNIQRHRRQLHKKEGSPN